MSRPITDEARADFGRHLAAADEPAAVALVLALLADGVGAEDVLLGLIAPAQIAVGAHWAAGEWAVTREHAATHVSERATEAVAAAVASGPPRPGAGQVAVACTDGEWHTLPARILTEVLRLRGFDARFLGGDVSAGQLLSDLHRHAPDVLALSCILSDRLPFAHRLVQVARYAGIPVLAGGPGFGPDGVWAAALGADLYAPDASRAADTLRLRWPPHRLDTRPMAAESIEDYAVLARRRPHLLAALLDALFGPDEARCEGAPETLGRLLDALAAGVFVDDPRLFLDHLAFAAAFLAARSVPPTRLHTVLDTLEAQLADVPSALAQAEAGRRHLDG